MPSIRLFGSPTVYDGENWVALGKGKLSALLYFLAYKQDWIGRDELILLFWPDNTDKQARSNLRTLLTRGSTKLKDFEVDIEPTRLRWLADADCTAFKKAYVSENWHEATLLYTGVLLQDYPCDDIPEFETWLETERETLEKQYISAALNCSQEFEDASEYGEAVQVLEKLYEKDKSDEHILRSYLRSLSLDQQWKIALDTYESFTRFIAKEYGSEPEETTLQFVEQIRLANRANMSKELESFDKAEIILDETSKEFGNTEKIIDSASQYLLFALYFLEPFKLNLNQKTRIASKAFLESYEDGLQVFRKLRKLDLVDENGFSLEKDAVIEELEKEPELKPYVLLKLIEASDDDIASKELSQTYFDEVGTFPESLITKLKSVYLEECKKAFKKGNYSQVVNLLTPLYEAEEYYGLKHDQDVGFNLAYANEREGKFDEVSEILKDVESNTNIEILKLTIAFRKGDFANGNNELESIEELFTPHPSWAKAQVFNLKGNLALREADFPQALQNFKNSEVVWDSLGDQNRRNGELTNIAITVNLIYSLEEGEKAFEYAYQQSLKENVSILEVIRVLYNWSIVYHNRSFSDVYDSVEHRQRNQTLYQKGKEKYQKALKLSRDSGQLAFMARMHMQEGLYYEGQGSIDKASAAYEKSREFARQSGEWLILAMATFRLGISNNDLARMEQGLQLMESSGGVETYDIEMCQKEYKKFVANSPITYSESLSA